MQMNQAQNIFSLFWQARSSLLLEHSCKIDLGKIYLLCSPLFSFAQALPQCVHHGRNGLHKGV
jgi:hypothetical protein